MHKQHNTADTSLQAYNQVKASGQLAREKEIVLKAIAENQPCTSRMLHKVTGIERTNITSVLHKLENLNQAIKKAFKRPCQISGFTAAHYALTNWTEIN